MTHHTMEELKKVVRKRQQIFRTKQSSRYHLARELGFSAEEAVVLQNWSEETIRNLAQQKEA